MQASVISSNLINSRRRHVAGIPWTKVLTYAIWAAMVSIPVAVAVAYEIESTRQAAPLKSAIEAERAAQEKELAEVEKLLGREVGGAQ